MQNSFVTSILGHCYEILGEISSSKKLSTLKKQVFISPYDAHLDHVKMNKKISRRRFM